MTEPGPSTEPLIDFEIIVAALENLYPASYRGDRGAAYKSLLHGARYLIIAAILSEGDRDISRASTVLLIRIAGRSKLKFLHEMIADKTPGSLIFGGSLINSNGTATSSQ